MTTIENATLTEVGDRLALAIDDATLKLLGIDGRTLLKIQTDGRALMISRQQAGEDPADEEEFSGCRRDDADPLRIDLS